MPDYTLEIVLFIIGLISSYLLAMWFGDKAGTQASIEYEKQKEQKQQEALKNQASLILSIVEGNAAQKRRGDVPYMPGQFNPFVKIPTVSFETALISGYLSEEREKRVNKFLAQAYTINSLIDYYRDFALVQTCVTGTVGRIAEENKSFIENVQALIDCLSESR